MSVRVTAADDRREQLAALEALASSAGGLGRLDAERADQLRRVVNAEGRAAAFVQLADRFGLELADAPASSGDEDAQAYLDPDDPDYEIDRWVAVTFSGEYGYLRCYSTFEAARDYATENCGDDIFAEAPGLIVDLDTGEEWKPDWRELPWRTNGGRGAPGEALPFALAWDSDPSNPNPHAWEVGAERYATVEEATRAAEEEYGERARPEIDWEPGWLIVEVPS